MASTPGERPPAVAPHVRHGGEDLGGVRVRREWRRDRRGAAGCPPAALAFPQPLLAVGLRTTGQRRGHRQPSALVVRRARLVQVTRPLIQLRFGRGLSLRHGFSFERAFETGAARRKAQAPPRAQTVCARLSRTTAFRGQTRKAPSNQGVGVPCCVGRRRPRRHRATGAERDPPGWPDERGRSRELRSEVEPR